MKKYLWTVAYYVYAVLGITYIILLDRMPTWLLWVGGVAFVVPLVWVIVELIFAVRRSQPIYSVVRCTGCGQMYRINEKSWFEFYTWLKSHEDEEHPGFEVREYNYKTKELVDG